MIEELAIILVRGIGLGSIYALVAISFNIVFSSSGILNFAQGNMFILGGLAGSILLGTQVDIGTWLLMLLVGGVLVAVALALQGYITLLPMRMSGDDAVTGSWVISTMAMSVVIGAVMLLTRGPFPEHVRTPFPNVSLLGTFTPAAYGLSVVMMLFWYFALKLFLSRTLTGLAISALSQDLEAARAAGLKVRRLQLIAFAISGLVVGTAGFVAAPVVLISADAGFKYVLNGFIAAVVGGIGNNLGALIGGPLVGILAVTAIYEVGGDYQNLASMLLLVALLMVRPEGIFGRTSARRV